MPSNVRRLNFRDHDWRNPILFLAGPALVTFVVALVFGGTLGQFRFLLRDKFSN